MGKAPHGACCPFALVAAQEPVIRTASIPQSTTRQDLRAFIRGRCAAPYNTFANWEVAQSLFQNSEHLWSVSKLESNSATGVGATKDRN
jgi:hypothetical protein